MQTILTGRPDATPAATAGAAAACVVYPTKKTIARNMALAAPVASRLDAPLAGFSAPEQSAIAGFLERAGGVFEEHAAPSLERWLGRPVTFPRGIAALTASCSGLFENRVLWRRQIVNKLS